MSRNMSRYFNAVVLVALVAILPGMSPAYSQTDGRTPSGTIRIEIVSGGFIIGATGGSGVLTYQGRDYQIGIGGLSVGLTIGASKTELIGRVYNLNRPSDIAGTYTAREAGLAVAGGKKVARLRNSKGVLLRVRGRQIGLEATLNLSGMEIWLK